LAEPVELVFTPLKAWTPQRSFAVQLPAIGPTIGGGYQI
jgi:hypothetical protein